MEDNLFEIEVSVRDARQALAIVRDIRADINPSSSNNFTTEDPLVFVEVLRELLDRGIEVLEVSTPHGTIPNPTTADLDGIENDVESGLYEASCSSGAGHYNTKYAFSSRKSPEEKDKHWKMVESMLKRIDETIKTHTPGAKEKAKPTKPNEEDKQYMGLKINKLPKAIEDPEYVDETLDGVGEGLGSNDGATMQKHKESNPMEKTKGKKGSLAESADISPKQDLNQRISNLNRSLYEISKDVQKMMKLKQEAGIGQDQYWKSTRGKLTKISERLIRLSNHMKRLGE